MKGLLQQLANLPADQRAAMLKKLKTGAAPQTQSTTVQPESLVWDLSSMQLRLWMLQNIEGESAAYNMATAFELRGPLQVWALEQALHFVLQRHQVLRVNFVLVNDLPVQQVQPTSVLPALQVCPCVEQDVPVLLSNFAGQPFDLSALASRQEIPVRYQLLQLAAGHHILLLNLHHIVADGWSIRIIAGQITQAYAALLQGQQPDIPALPQQYGDFVQAQFKQRGSARQQQLLQHWQQKLAGAPPLLELPLDQSRPASWSSRGAEQRFRLDLKLQQELETVARTEGVTLYMLLLAAFQLLLARYSNQTDILVGTPVANRDPQWQNQVGMFVNTLVLRSQIDGSQSFRQYLQQVKQECLDAFAHQDLPIELLVEALAPSRTLSHAPLIQNMFALHDARQDALTLSGLQVCKLDIPVRHVKFDLLLSLELHPGGIEGRLEYSSDIYAAGSMQRFQQHYQQLLRQICRDVTRSVLQLPLLSEQELSQLHHVWNNTEQSFETGTLMHEFFLRQAEQAPDATALIYAGRQLTYAELKQRSAQLAYVLRQGGVKPNELVAVICDKGFEQVIAVLAVLMAGGAYLPIETDWPAARVDHLLEFGLVSNIVTQASVAQRSQWSGQRQIHLLDASVEFDPAAPQCCDRVQQPSDLAYVIFTSGSTGQPKGVVIQHQAVVNTLLDINQRYQVGAGDRALAISALSFDLSVYDIFGLLAVGGTVVIPEDEHNKDPRYWLDLLHQHKVTLWNTVPALMQMLVDYCETSQQSPNPQLRWCFMSGDWIPLELPKRIKALSDTIEIHSGGGATEASIWSITYPVRELDPQWSSIPYGRPLANQKFYILNDALQPCPLNVTGNLFIGGVGVAHSYWRDAEKTAAHFVTDPTTGERLYKTGDLGRFVRDGLIEFMGRADFQVKINGYRIELGEIEAVIRAQPEVRDVLVVVRAQGDSKRLVAYVLSQAALDTAALMNRISSQLPDYMLPAAVLVMDSFPLTANGKVDQKALPEPVFAVHSEQYLAPRNELESQLAGLFCQLLQRDQVSIDQRFFALGGHSLTAARLVARLRQELQIELPVRELFVHDTVESLARRIMQLSTTLTLPPLVLVATEGQQYPVATGQYGLYLQIKQDSSAKAYNMPGAIRLQGRLDVTRLEQAMRQILQRHQALRSRFVEVDGELRQEIRTEVPFSIRHLDWQQRSLSCTEQAIQALAYDEAAKPFDLEKDLLIRLSLVRLTETQHVLLFCLHHLVCDGWSFTILLQELSVFYADSSLPAPACQYADYSHWQQCYLQTAARQQQLAYWQQQLSQLPACRFPFEVPATTDHGEGFTLPFSINAADSKALLQLAQQQSVTPYVLLLSAFSTLLSWYCNQPDLTLATTVAGRPLQAFESVVGYFANQLVLRFRVSGQQQFSDWTQQVQQQVMDVLQHQDVPFWQVAEHIVAAQGVTVPLFRAKFVYQGDMSLQLALPELDSQTLHVDNGSAKYDLLVIMGQDSAGLSGTVQYREHCFSKGSISPFIRLWQAVLAGLAANPQQTVAELQHLAQQQGGRSAIQADVSLVSRRRLTDPY